jgi:hypothetical protein
MIFALLGAASCALLASEDRVSVINDGGSAIEPGKGYSGDSQTVSSIKCYDMKVSNVSAERGRMKMDEAMTFSQVE